MSNQDKKANLVIRKSRPQTLGASFGGLLDTFGIRASDADLANNWKNIVGAEIANISKVVAVKQKRDKKIDVVLRPMSPAFVLELSYKVDECIKKLNKYYGRDIVSKITIRK